MISDSRAECTMRCDASPVELCVVVFVLERNRLRSLQALLVRSGNKPDSRSGYIHCSESERELERGLAQAGEAP